MTENTQETAGASMSDHLADLNETMQREKIPLSPEMKAYLKQSVEAVQTKLMNREPIYPKDMEFVEKIKTWMSMSKEFREKYPDIEQMKKGSMEILHKLNLDKSYDEMSDTLQNYGYMDKIPDKQTVMKAIINLGPQMLENIKKFNRPTILMTPKETLGKMREKIDQNKKYSDSNGQQGDTYFREPTTSPLWNPKAIKFSVSIVDGAPEMPQLPQDKVNLDNEHKHKYLSEEYKKQGMKMISAREYAMLAQKSLRSYEQSQKADEMIDQSTATYLNADHLTDLRKMPLALWPSVCRRFDFDWLFSDDQYDVMRGRPSVQVLVT